MKLWKCEYTLYCKLTKESSLHVDYIWSVVKPFTTTIQRKWDIIFPNNYEVTQSRWTRQIKPVNTVLS